METVQQQAPARIYRMPELVEATGFSRDAIRKLIERGVLPPCHGRGMHGYYTDVHLSRLQRIRKEREQRRTLADYRELFNRPASQRSARAS